MESGSKVKNKQVPNKWPRIGGKLWIGKEDVICKVQEPQAVVNGSVHIA